MSEDDCRKDVNEEILHIPERVRKGIQLLNDFYEGYNWKADIDEAKLNMQDGCNCVGAHLAGSYALFFEKFSFKLGDAFEYGFQTDIKGIQFAQGGMMYYSALTAEWKKQLRELKEMI